jgi:hypothetical protein
VVDVARRHGVNANLLFTWRRQQGAAKMADSREGPQLAPVTIAAEPVSGIPAMALEPVGRMEIVLGAGERIIVGADVDTAALARVATRTNGICREIIPVPSGVRVWLATGHTDLHKGWPRSDCPGDTA